LLSFNNEFCEISGTQSQATITENKKILEDEGKRLSCICRRKKKKKKK